MKKLIWILVALVLVAGGYFVYNKLTNSDDLVNSIPEKSTFVVVFDFKSIALKAGGEKLKEMNMMKGLRDELKKMDHPSATIISELIDDPLKSGINFLKKSYLFVSLDNNKPSAGFIAGLLSSDNFEKTIRSLFPTDSITVTGGIKSISYHNEATLAWNSNQVVFLGGSRDSSANYLEKYFNHNSPSIAGNKQFKKFNSESFDAGMFINYKELVPLAQKGAPGAGLLISDLYKDMSVSMSTNFEDNSIVTKMNTYFDSKEAEEKLNMMNEKGISNDHLKLITQKNVFGILSASLNMEKMVSLLESNPMFGGIIMEVAQQAGLSKEELKELLSGEITLACTDIREEAGTRKKYDFDETTGNMSETEVADTSMMPMFTATIGIKSHAAYEKIMKRSGLQKEGLYYILNLPVMKIYMVENKIGVTITNDKLLAQEMAEKKQLVEVGEPVKNIVTNYPFGFYMNLDMNAYPEPVLHSIQEQMGAPNYAAFTGVMKNLKDVEAFSEKTSGRFDIKFTEGQGNSLYRMLNAIDQHVYPLVAERRNAGNALAREAAIDSVKADANVNTMDNKQ